MNNENIAAVEAFLSSLEKHDLSLAPLSDNISFDDPVAGKGTGVENFRAFLDGFLPAINAVRIRQHISEGDYVVTHWEADTVFGIIPMLEKFCVVGGKITEAIAYFDPRPIIGG
ncbi:MAG: nuclear transport factor 2 family protein [Pyrinomonadaceae bacterium]